MSNNGQTVKMTYREAVKQGLREALNRDERVFLMGADVGRYGGCFAVSKGLFDEYGPERIRDCPLSESSYTGIGLGAAMGGMRPIVEIMTVNFSMLALDQIVNTAALYLHMSGGIFNVRWSSAWRRRWRRQLSTHSLEGWRISRRRSLQLRSKTHVLYLGRPRPSFDFEQQVMQHGR
jgi:hypothetical protein